MSAVNEKDLPILKKASAAKLNMHDYAAAAASVETPMETSKSATGTKRQLNTTPTKLPPAKQQATESEVSLAAVLAAIKSLDNKVDDFRKQLQENSEMFACFTLQVEQNTFGIAKCKSTIEN
ncbi:hypothetical protein XENOCAPTIV_009323 [Xenoophorus captivus]|uniref:Uncharacterized protein n=1 Tax=Xenoophorus captivus TaxID=1517983 RepID=A0ABV0QRY7_9TELE